MARQDTGTLGMVAALLLAACSSGGGGGPGSGKFLDSAVEGLGFTSGGVSGLTDGAGTFQIDGGSPVTFRIGDIVLGQSAAKAVVTPVDLVPGASDETNATVTNIARLLITLDTDESPFHRITIDAGVTAAAVGQAIDFAVDTTTFTSAAQGVVDVLTAGLPGGPRPLVSAAVAQQHLAGTLIGTLAGFYQGDYAGDDSGPFSVYIDRTGELFGYAISASDGLLALEGDIFSDGGFLAGVVSSGATFTGSIDGDGTLAGSWELLPEQGTFLGARTAGVDAFINLDLIGTLVGTYEGTSVSNIETAPITVLLDAFGDLSIPPPDDDLAATVTSTTSGLLVFSGLAADGTTVSGTIDGAGGMSGSFSNPFEGESGTFTAMLVP